MLINIKGVDVKIREKSCDCNGTQGFYYKDKAVNLYVSLTSECNTNCKFCVFRGKGKAFNLEKFKEVVDEILRECSLHKVAFTGGEPTLEFDTLVKCATYIKERSPYTEVKVNTNGTYLKLLDGLTCLDNVSLSRHSIRDDENIEIFQSDKVPSLEEIRAYKGHENLHLSCNIMKGYVDSQAKIIEYLEGVSDLGLKAVGFVSLMPVNEFAKEKGIDFETIPLELSNRFTINREYQYRPIDKCVCKCRNYLYLAKNNQVVQAFNRFVVDRDCDTAALFYDGEVLKEGFKGRIIY